MRKPVFFLKFLFLLCLVAGGVTPSRLTPYSPYLPGQTGGEKYSDFSDSGAVAIRLHAQGERNIRISATSVLWLLALSSTV